MPLFMDRHDVPGASAEDVAQAHVKDLEASKEFGVRFISYWFDADGGGVFCFADAPSRQALAEVHSKSHGLIPNEIIDVSADDVFRFLGSVHEPRGVSELSSPLRTVLFTDLVGSTAILDKVGDAAFMDVIGTHDGIVREALYRNHGREVKHTGDGIMACFDDAGDGVRAALSIRGSFDGLDSRDGVELRVRIGMAAGRPVDHNDDIYGEAVVLASRLCDAAATQQILATESVREHAEDEPVFTGPVLRSLKGFAEPVRCFEIREQASTPLIEEAGTRAGQPWWARIFRTRQEPHHP